MENALDVENGSHTHQHTAQKVAVQSQRVVRFQMNTANR